VSFVFYASGRIAYIEDKSKMTSFPQNRHFYHYLFWITLFFSMLFELSSLLGPLGAVNYLLVVSGRIVLFMGLVYINLIILLPTFYPGRRRYYWICFLVCLSLFCVLGVGFNKLLGFPALERAGRFNLTNLSVWFFAGLRLLFLSSILKLSVDWYDQQTKIHQLESAGLQAEVNFLKSQLNPHFLFNTLNNLQSLIIKKSPKAVRVVENLSDIMDYMLYDSQVPFIHVKEEIKYLKNYLDLEQMRKADAAKITIKITGEAGSYTIAPLLMLPLVENAVKHGLDKVEEDGSLDVQIELKNGVLLLTVKNKINENDGVSREGVGIGIPNMVRRLDLLYSNKYSFERKYEHHYHTAFLKLNLV
jgi:two-component system, LytTR family, sensor kinase